MFPRKSKYLKKNMGWEDLGEVIKSEVHVYCGTRVFIGKENGKVFKFCPKCLVKVDNVSKEDRSELLEYCANLEHERWASWQKWLHQCSIKNEDGTLTMPKEKVERWERQIKTNYKDLSEKEKESDRHQVIPYLEYILDKIL